MWWLISKRWCWVTVGRGDKYQQRRAAPREQQLSAPWTASRPPVWLQSACEQRQTPGGGAKKQHGTSTTQILDGKQDLSKCCLVSFSSTFIPSNKNPWKNSSLTCCSCEAVANPSGKNAQTQRERERNTERSGAEGLKDRKNRTSFTTPFFVTSGGSVAALSLRLVCLFDCFHKTKTT